MYIVQTVYEDINLTVLEAACHPPRYGSEMYIMQIQLDTVLV